MSLVAGVRGFNWDLSASFGAHETDLRSTRRLGDLVRTTAPSTRLRPPQDVDARMVQTVLMMIVAGRAARATG